MDVRDRRRTMELPKAETGLAEWTSKIKAMQRQVDADEEAEQKRLEEEIAASRRARLRRSQGIGYGNRESALDSPQSTDFSNTLTGLDKGARADDMKPLAERQKIQSETQRTLMDGGPSRNSNAARTAYSLASPSLSSTGSTSPAPPIAKKPEAISLAAFMGGRATGPMLRKHAPQQDAHDPTQFEQHTKFNAPHPVFGRGGVAMPGMTSTGRSAPIPSPVGLSHNDHRESPSPVGPSSRRDRTLSTPPGTKRHAEGAQEHTLTPKLENGFGSRERAVSTPGRSSPPVSRTSPREAGPKSPAQERHFAADMRSASSSVGLPSSQSRQESLSRPQEIRGHPISTSSAKNPRTPPPLESSGMSVDQSRRPVSQTSFPSTVTTPIHGRSPTKPLTFSPSRTVAASYTPRQESLPSFPVTPPSKQSSITIPSLARPIRPDPKPSPQGPQLTSSSQSSPAFLRPQAQKDLTPSLSRLKGRGFVQNMVKVSTQLETSTGSPSSDKSPSVGGRRQSSVLDRWHSMTATSSTTVTPPVSPKPTAVRKPHTVGLSTSASFETSPLSEKTTKSNESSETLRAVASVPSIKATDALPSYGRHSTNAPLNESSKRKSIPDAIAPERTPGLGSSSTLISYIKPTKTGDDPLTVQQGQSSALPAEADELGIRTRVGRTKEAMSATRAATPSELPAVAVKPLSHPTKARARKPRKATDGSQGKKVKDEGSDALTVSGLSTDFVHPGTQQRIMESPTTSTSALPVVEARHDPRSAQETLPPSLISEGPVNVGVLMDKWAERTIIDLKPANSYDDRIAETRVVRPKTTTSGLFGGRALPGLATSTPSLTPKIGEPAIPAIFESGGIAARRELPLLSSPLPPPDRCSPKEDKSPKSPSSPGRHPRIPSTGHRATVMDIAQALRDPRGIDGATPIIVQKHEESLSQSEAVADNVKPADAVSRTRHTTPPSVQAERRKSNYERYSAIMLPPLKEEATPAPSPATTLSRNTDAAGMGYPNGSLIAKTLQGSLDGLLPTMAALTEFKQPADDNVIHFYHNDKPLPDVDISILLKVPKIFTPNPDVATISVDVMAITGNTASAVTRNNNVFYDSEVLAVVHRSKSRSTGLVSTQIWGWRGKRSHVTERETRKLQELAKRYGTTLEIIHQYSETAELVHALGGRLAMRQGTRAHWSSENTAMHLVRSLNGLVFIDEHDLSVKNLCSGFSYCLSILDTLYVWHGSGSRERERCAALEYAKEVAAKGTNVVELVEGETDEDEMFWMMLGDEDYAKADYWKWRHTDKGTDPRIWRIDSESVAETFRPVLSFVREEGVRSSVYLIDCVWEIFVLVGKEARSRRRDIMLAVDVAMKLSRKVATSRPYPPTVHVLVLPTQIPLDLRLTFRDTDEVLNDGSVPDHMNIISCAEALEHLRRTSWDRSTLRDRTMLPLGLDISDLD